MKEGTMAKQVTATLPNNEAQALADLARTSQVSKTDIVRKAIRAYVAHRTLSDIQQRLQPLAKRLGIRSDRDVYRLLGEE
jgi:predicted transcriptional regulator